MDKFGNWLVFTLGTVVTGNSYMFSNFYSLVQLLTTWMPSISENPLGQMQRKMWISLCTLHSANVTGTWKKGKETLTPATRWMDPRTLCSVKKPESERQALHDSTQITFQELSGRQTGWARGPGSYCRKGWVSDSEDAKVLEWMAVGAELCLDELEKGQEMGGTGCAKSWQQQRPHRPGFVLAWTTWAPRDDAQRGL